MRLFNRQTLGEVADRVNELTLRVAELTRRLELSEGVAGACVLNQETDSVAGEADDSSHPIEFITENGFSIVRPWESGKSPRPTAGKLRFSVTDGFIEREVTVEISRRVTSEIELRTRGRIVESSLFWISCAERHLANHVSEHADFPEDDELIVEELNPEDILSLLRWGKSG
jgi:hypothetical protein